MYGNVAFQIVKIVAAWFVVAAMIGQAQAKKEIKADFDFEHVSCNGGENEIRLVITDVKHAVGLMAADLYPNKEEGFLKRTGRIKQVKFAAKSPVTSFCLTTPGPGDYAIAVYQDVNANGRFDKSAFGLPNEPWGLSQNPKVRFRPPLVEEMIFPVPAEGANIAIRLR